MTEPLTGVDGDALVRRAYQEAGRELRLLGTSADVLARFVDAAGRGDTTDVTIRVLVDPGVLKRAMDDFLVASAASDLIDADALTVRTRSDPTPHSLVVVDDDSVVSFVSLDDTVGALQSTDDELLSAATEAFSDGWEAGDPYEARAPPMSRVMTTLRDEIGDATAEDFGAILDRLDTARGDDGLDEIAVALLAAARNEVLLYDISKWGEDSGVASKATFSRKKTEMEDAGLLDTENVPIDIGRPRLRLKFVDETLHGAPLGDVVAAARDALA